jgi:glycosyltransferase involved in cell wall biosynthesis
MTKKLPISALIASYNEGHLLDECLKSIDFCEELIVIDFFSNDNTLEIAKKYTDTIFQLPRPEYIEMIFPDIIPKLKYDWFVLLDPDERILPELKSDILKYMENPLPLVSKITVPMKNHFMGMPIKGKNSFITDQRLLYNRVGIEVSNEIHNAFKLKPGYGKYHIPQKNENYIKHYWCNSWAQLKNKQNRYIKGDGFRLYHLGKRYNIFNLFFYPVFVFFKSYFLQKLFKDGVIGVGLSWYDMRHTFLAHISLFKYEKALKNKGLHKKPKEEEIQKMKLQMNMFIDNSIEIFNQIETISDENHKSKILQEYKRGLFRIVNDALELNQFKLAEKVIQLSSSNKELCLFVSNELLLDRLKLIQCSKSYRLAQNFSYLRRLFN